MDFDTDDLHEKARRNKRIRLHREREPRPTIINWPEAPPRRRDLYDDPPQRDEFDETLDEILSDPDPAPDDVASRRPGNGCAVAK